MKKVWGLLKTTLKEFGEDKVLRLSASLAYYTLFSIGPLLFILVFIAGLVFGQETVQRQIAQQIQSFVGEQSAQTVLSMIKSPTAGGNLITTIIGIVTLVFGATGVFGQLQDALNTIWEVEPKPGQGVWGFIRSRFLSTSMVLGLGFLLLISMVLTTAVEGASTKLGTVFPIPDWLVAALAALVSFLVVMVFFALVFKLLPDVKVKWRPIWIGALLTAALFTIGKFLLSLYLGRQATASSYGAAGSVAVLLLWIYYASVIMFLGAEFTQVYARRTGAVLGPAHYAKPVTGEERAQQGIPKEERDRPQQPPLEGPAGPEPQTT